MVIRDCQEQQEKIIGDVVSLMQVINSSLTTDSDLKRELTLHMLRLKTMYFNLTGEKLVVDLLERSLTYEFLDGIKSYRSTRIEKGK